MHTILAVPLHGNGTGYCKPSLEMRMKKISSFYPTEESNTISRL